MWAGDTHGYARQTDLKLALFHAHFNARRPIGERAVLLDIAQETGFDRAEAEVALDSSEWAHKVRAEERAAYDLNITGVPAMVVENAFMIPGAQSPQVYADALRRVAEKLPA